MLVVAATVAVLGWVMLVAGPVLAQRAQTPLEIGSMRHTLVDGHSIIVVLVRNMGVDTLDATGEFSLVDAFGEEVAVLMVSTGPLPPGATSALALPIPTVLDPGRYTGALSLVDSSNDVQANSGLREILVESGEEQPAPTIPPAGTPVSVEEDAGGGGFPAWILLIIGLGMSVLGVTYMRSASAPRKTAQPFVPQVSMVRKVKVATPSPKRPATIKPLVPPRRRDDG